MQNIDDFTFVQIGKLTKILQTVSTIKLQIKHGFDMTAIFTWLFIFCNFSNFLMSAASSCEEKLPKLDDETMQATFGSSLYHSPTMRGNIGLFHGKLWVFNSG